MKRAERWYSERVGSDVTVARWGHFGRPVIVFPTAGGDAEEVERMWLVDSVGEDLEAGRGKIYSCDSVSGGGGLCGAGGPRARWSQDLLLRQRVGGGDASRRRRPTLPGGAAPRIPRVRALRADPDDPDGL